MATCNDYGYIILDNDVADCCLPDDDRVWRLINLAEFRSEDYAKDLFESRHDDVVAFLDPDNWGWSDYELVMSLGIYLTRYVWFNICIGKVECDDDIEDVLENAFDELMTDEFAKYFNYKCDKLGIGD